MEKKTLQPEHGRLSKKLPDANEFAETRGDENFCFPGNGNCKQDRELYAETGFKAKLRIVY